MEWYNYRPCGDSYSGQQTRNNLKGNNAQNLMMRMNPATTFDDVHQWISNYFNSTYIGNYTNENYDKEEYNEEEYDENWESGTTTTTTQ
eukprot:3010782-Amphidinium_carterae.1